MKRIFLAAAVFAGGNVLACDFPDEGGNITWRRVVAKVRYQPSVEAWAIERAKAGGAVQYVVALDSPRRARAAAGGQLKCVPTAGCGGATS